MKLSTCNCFFSCLHWKVSRFCFLLKIMSQFRKPMLIYTQGRTHILLEKKEFIEKTRIMPASRGLKFSTVITSLSGGDSASLKAVLVLTLGWDCPPLTSFKTPLQSIQSKYLAGGLALHPRGHIDAAALLKGPGWFPPCSTPQGSAISGTTARSSPLPCRHAFLKSKTKEKEEVLILKAEQPT